MTARVWNMRVCDEELAQCYDVDPAKETTMKLSLCTVAVAAALLFANSARA